MTRRPDWAARMFDTFDAHSGRPFEWGKDDCCLFVARVVDAMTGSQFASDLAALYHDETSANALIDGAGGLEGAVSAILGASKAADEYRAMRGDVVLIDGGLGDAVGICRGIDVLAMGPRGLQKLDRSEIRKVWPIR